ncbi:hypothetical protein HMPREF0043_02347 [Actinobaculum sp. oral taxon 183 str. F0552]|nr:hypothetical protein HMPREF0043_02347 [Actinobaculum sp. oral taxon 183 str. F0552]
MPVPRGVQRARPPCGPSLRPGGAAVGRSAGRLGTPFGGPQPALPPASEHPERRDARLGRSCRATERLDDARLNDERPDGGIARR